MNNIIIPKNYKKLYEKYKYKYIKLKIKEKKVISADKHNNIIPSIEEFIHNISINSNKSIDNSIEINKKLDINDLHKIDFYLLNNKYYDINISLLNNQVAGTNNNISLFENINSKITNSNESGFLYHADNCMCFMPCGS